MPRALVRGVPLILFCLVGFFSSARFSAAYALAEKYVRVAVLEDAGSFSLKVSGFYAISDAANNKVLYRGRNLKATVTAHKGGILIGGKSFAADKVSVSARDPDIIAINGRLFRGDIRLIRNSRQKLYAVNDIDLEDYIKGILYHEASHYWPQEALRAQAIACRTYALYQCQQNQSKDYDVTSDVYSQVYGGKASERYRTNKAVEETAGYALTYNGGIFPAYFHATCGGHTEDASLLWNIDIAPLKGAPCGFCKESPHFNWHYVMAKNQLEKKLAEAGYQTSGIEGITILGRDRSGRITGLEITSPKKEVRLSAKEFRQLLGPDIVRSNNFSLTVVGGDIVFEGFGWGHGAGLCQWGAYFMAKQGYTAEQILKYYYPGSDVKVVRF